MYFRNIGVALTQLLGAVLGITLNPNETTSGAALRIPVPWLRKGIDKLFFWQESHCKRAVQMEIEDCKELLLAYGYQLSPPKTTIEEAAKEIVTKAPMSTAQKQEAPGDNDPMSDAFDAQAWFTGLNTEARKRVVEWGVSIKMSRENRKKVAQIAQKWHNKDAVVREGHGM